MNEPHKPTAQYYGWFLLLAFLVLAFGIIAVGILYHHSLAHTSHIPARQHVLHCMALLTALMLALGALLSLLWRHQRTCLQIARLQAQQTLQALSSRHEALLTAIPDIVMEVDTNKVYTWANPAGLDFFGEDVAGREAALYFEGEQDTYRQVAPLFNGDEATRYVESWQRRCDGQERLLAWRCRTLKDDQGHVIGALSTARDITDRVRAEEALRESEERFRTFFDHAPIGKCMTRPNGRFAFVNKTFARMLGYSQGELAGLPFVAITHPDDVAESRECVRGLLAGERDSWSMDKRYLARDGRVVWAHVTTCLLRDTEGQPRHFLTHIQDLSQLRQADAQICMMAEMLDAAPSSITVHDFQGRFLYANGKTYELHGYDRDEFTALTLRDLDVPESEVLLAERMRLLAEQSEARFEVEHFRKDGSTFPLEVYARIVEWNGQPAILSIATDITERRRAQEALIESARLWQDTLDGIRDSICLLDCSGVVRRANRTTELLIGRSQADIMGRHCWEVFHNGSGPLEDCPIQRMKRSLKRETMPLPLDGRLYEVTVDPFLDQQGRLQGAIHTISDITVRKQLEEERLHLAHQVEQVRKLESLAVMAGGVAHDFNNLLTIIQGHAELALMDPSSETDQRNSLTQITTAVDRAAGLCHQMLAYSGSGCLLFEQVNLGQLLRRAADELRAGIPECVSLTLDLAADLPPVHGDPTQLRQLLTNLVVNATEAVGDGPGQISITASVRQCQEEDLYAAELLGHLDAGWYMMLEVSDTGVGMDAATRERLFEPFFSTKFLGRGLGLAAVLGIVKSHEGTIKVESQPGQGSTFTVLLPALLADKACRDQCLSSISGLLTRPLNPDRSEFRPQ